MRRIDESGAVGNRFVRSNPGIGQQATRIGADWPNNVQEEICAVIEGAGLTVITDPDDDDNTQLKQAIEAMIGIHGTQLGEAKTFLRKPAETAEYKFPNGQHLALPTYAALATALAGDPFLAVDDADKTANPGKWRIAGDNTYIAMPDLRGQFARIWHDDLVDGVARPALGVRKGNQNAAHTHTVNEGSSTPSAGTLTSGDDYTSTVYDTINTGSSGGDETVPDHTAVYVLIRVK